MKIASQDGLAPGDTLEERMSNLKSYGFEGVEIWGRGLLEDRGQIAQAKRASERAGIPISTICAGYRGCVLDCDPGERELAMEDIKELLYITAEVGAVGLIFVPIFGPPRLNDLSPLSSAVDLERALLVRLLEDLGRHAERAGTLLLVEPLNRYETHLLNRLEQAADICEEVGNPHIKIMADFFHMSIEEADIAKSLRGARGYVKHVHLADSNRVLPGLGHTDFASGFAALKAMGFGDFMALECGVPGERAQSLKKCVAYLRSCMPKPAKKRATKKRGK